MVGGRKKAGWETCQHDFTQAAMLRAFSHVVDDDKLREWCKS
jgi:hypothetical protein